jgi:hypothetical protein
VDRVERAGQVGDTVMQPSDHHREIEGLSDVEWASEIRLDRRPRD